MFCNYNFEVYCVTNGSEIFKLLQKRTFDLVLLDLLLPNEGGLEMCKQLRQTSEVPIIISVLNSISERVLRLEYGAEIILLNRLIIVNCLPEYMRFSDASLIIAVRLQ